MKKISMIMAAAFAAPLAFAQTNVTLFGVVDMSVAHVQGSGNGSRSGIATGSSAPGRLGFRGTEDLGGGLSAGFWLEGALDSDVGNANGFNFQRRATVSLLSNSLGELRMGRDNTPLFLNLIGFDPFAARGVGGLLTNTYFGYSSTVRQSNTVTYLLPSKLGGVYGLAQYAFGEKSSTALNDKQNDFVGGRLGYMSGPANVVAAYGQWKQAIGASDVAPFAEGRDLNVGSITGTYNFGFIKPVLFYGSERVKGAPAANSRIDTMMIGATAPIGASEIKVSLAHHDLKNSANDFNKFALGYGYYLSKRTYLYGTVARLNNKGTATRSISADGLAAAGTSAGGNSNGFEFGVRHSF
ncbi:porin [Xylophilus sp. GOD-11R]|uniref:porin n=1 Tax=Xylophilus sp. GOD-11R TaxID=3089814 RepID=UPI00298D0E49|nr:porin [Xylophilus sp. GOD-11R]WPB57176.1 porin [Xylophilus sp. GOD-11R]